ncbi:MULTISPECIES: roadblock/LC7 domain-containing protein [Actinosynnema]|uniref:Roadblock/LC7 family protein n=3 Tax=Actinosynnema TaxID=40566 RepID=C6WD67_ACTMD|nr:MULTISPECIES: roadblock/LC7 domain-containing protein [Actinosynnema]AXX31118.1 hypothetical protein APASM_3753 [Actinosynnema pretiosum subsp. pretiosum]ACU37686.1 Roadblock/LC7 family protein [Actinosynnema mirum DSM 43827]ATE55124.1 hypothetical protein CNX65_19045 [Actinosynnema pretiosum]MCP2098179.1 hypothetical protein [Actinosynnema pretiosum]QUF04804.1 roadblock/LC7 domain-containing protein [Actinosynnema pretiosum subsp. pretiosum]
MTRPGGNRMQIHLSDPAVLAELLGRVRREIEGIESAIATSRDGIVLALDTEADTPEADQMAAHAAAMAAAAAGIGFRFIEVSKLGRLQGVLLEGERGCIAVLPLSGTLLLLLMGSPGVALGRFTVAAKRAMNIILSPEAY